MWCRSTVSRRLSCPLQVWAVTYTVEDPTVSGTSPQAREEAKQLGIDPLSEDWRRKVTIEI